MFPELEPLLKRPAGLLSGGEQQMLTVARALGRNPSVMLLDELSLGLAPIIVHRLLHAVRAASKERGVGVLLVEQHVRQALEVADRVYVMQRGRIVALRLRTRDRWPALGDRSRVPDVGTRRASNQPRVETTSEARIGENRSPLQPIPLL